MCRYEGCDKTFPTAHKLKVHKRRHQADRKPYKCEIEGCSKVFSAPGTLTSHIRTHSGEKPHACPVDGCEKRFTKASKLKLHLRSHTGERPFHCEIEVCTKKFLAFIMHNFDTTLVFLVFSVTICYKYFSFYFTCAINNTVMY